MSQSTISSKNKKKISYDEFKVEILKDFELCVMSREASLIGRKEVLTGKAKFGIFGDGKELPQVVLAKFMRAGDIRSGYYRDQTLMFATEMSNAKAFFAQLYAHPDQTKEPSSAGRMMNGHYASRWLDDNGEWKDLTQSPQSTSDISPTSGQMVRALGIAYASKLYRNNPELHQGFEKFSKKGDEISIVTIGDASTSEGPFWETINAAGVLQVPLAVFIWDDGYGISVPRSYQTTKNSISEALAGMAYDENLGSGLKIHTARAWNYTELVDTIQKGLEDVRKTHIPAIFHIKEVTQPQGHSTSGSHERYKSKERLEWEKEMDCIAKFEEFILNNEIATEEEITEIKNRAIQDARSAKQEAWDEFIGSIKDIRSKATELLNNFSADAGEQAAHITQLTQSLNAIKEPIRKDIIQTIEKVLRANGHLAQNNSYKELNNYKETLYKEAALQFNSHIHSESKYAVGNVKHIPAVYDDNSVVKNGFEILNTYFDQLFANNPAVCAFGEDVGKIGDVNQAFAGLQEKYGAFRVTDTGIRENTIIGQGLGLAMRGLRPITEIQYLDYLLYAIQPLSDDIATMQYRTRGGQKCPIIVRTRGHRLEGIWHSGSPMGMIINSVRGMNVCVPRNMVQAAGMYNTLLQSDEPAIVVECLNGYRLKEKQPNNLQEFTVPLGHPEVIREGEDITIVSYGSTLRIIEEAIVNYLEPAGISCEVVDVQTLLPFDINHTILESLKKTSRIVFIDEDVPGGASAYMFQQVMEIQGGYKWLDATPRTLSAKAHRPAYATDGDYFSKPNAEEIATLIQEVAGE